MFFYIKKNMESSINHAQGAREQLDKVRSADRTHRIHGRSDLHTVGLLLVQLGRDKPSPKYMFTLTLTFISID